MLVSDSLTEKKTSWCLQILYSQWLFFSSSLRESVTAKKGFSFLLDQLPLSLSSSSISNLFPFLFCFVLLISLFRHSTCIYPLPNSSSIYSVWGFFEEVMLWNFNEDMDSIDICPMSAILEYLEYEGTSGDCLVQTSWSEQGQLKYIFGCIFLSGTGVDCGLSMQVLLLKNLLLLSKPVCLCTAPQHSTM